MKKYLLGIASILLALSFTAFNVKREVKPGKVFTHYFRFEGNDNFDLNDRGLWADLGTNPPLECPGTDVVCIVSAAQTSLSDFQSAVSTAAPHSESALDNMDGVDIYSRKNP